MAGAKVILHGAIGSGKSTAARAAMRRLDWTRSAGFFTHWGGATRGAETLYFETWAGEKRPMARRRAESGAAGNPPYELDADFARLAAARLSSAGAAPVVIDELGLVEADSAPFAAAVAGLFRGPAPVLAVIQDRALARWLGVIKPTANPQVMRVDAASRDALPEAIAALFRP